MIIFNNIMKLSDIGNINHYAKHSIEEINRKTQMGKNR